MKKVLILLVAIVSITSCTKVIDVDLNESNPVVVLEANYNANDSTVEARITLTSSFFNSDPSETVDNAVVTIIDENGAITVVPAIGDGDYLLTGYVPILNSDYTMTVTVDGTTYSSTSTLYQSVEQDDIVVEYFPPGPFTGDGVYVPFIRYQDPSGVENYFEILLSKNNKDKHNLNDITTQDDALNDGNYIERPLFSVRYDLGDTIGIELRSIDKNVFNYLNQAISTVSDQNSAAPGNPTSNWDNNALGYFSAHSSSEKTIIVQ